MSESYSPREGANCISASSELLQPEACYSPREGVNCIEKRYQKQKRIIELQSP